MDWNEEQCSTVSLSVVHHNTMQCNTMQSRAMQWSGSQCNTSHNSFHCSLFTRGPNSPSNMNLYLCTIHTSHWLALTPHNTRWLWLPIISCIPNAKFPSREHATSYCTRVCARWSGPVDSASCDHVTQQYCLSDVTVHNITAQCRTGKCSVILHNEIPSNALY